MFRCIPVFLLLALFTSNISHASGDQTLQYASYVKGGGGIVYGVPTVGGGAGFRWGRDRYVGDVSIDGQIGVIANAINGKVCCQYRPCSGSKLRPYLGGGAGLSYRDFWLPLVFVNIVHEEMTLNAEGVVGMDWHCAQSWSLFAEGNVSWPLISHDSEKLHWRTQDPMGTLAFGLRHYW